MSEPDLATGLRSLTTLLAAMTILLVASAAARAGTVVVNVGGSQPPVFNPATITIEVGDTVAFVNKGGVHNVVADDNAFRCALGCDGDGHGGNGNASSSNWVAILTFAKPGRFGYFCEAHGQPGQGMFGTITVAAPALPVEPVPGGDWKFATLLVGMLALIAGLRLVRRRDR